VPTRRLIVLIAGNFFVATSLMSVGGLLNEIAASLRISIAQAGLLIAAFALTAAFCAPVLATVGSRIDRRKLLTWALAIGALANIFAALSASYGQLMAARILAAITSAVYTPQVAATVSMLVPERERGTALAKLMMGWAIGTVVGSPLVVLIGTSYGWRVALGAIGVASGMTAALVWRALPTGVHVPVIGWRRWMQVIRTPGLMLLTGTTLLNSVGNTLVFSLIAPIASAIHGLGGKSLAALFFVNGIGGLSGNLLGVSLIQRLGAGRLAFASGVFIAVAFALWPLLAGSLTCVFLLQMVWSLGSGSFPSSQHTRLVMIAPGLAAATIALNSSVGYLGGSLGTLFGVTAWELVGPRYMPWVALIFVLASLLCSRLGERAASRAAEAQRPV
jgi:MFS transporter, DHA1 family, inner membrane transport protein